MTLLVLKSLVLLLGAFVLCAAVGWMIAPRARRASVLDGRADRAAFDDETALKVVGGTEAGLFPPVVEEAAPKPAKPEPVSYLDAAAEAFTSGVTTPVRAESLVDKAPYAPMQPGARLETVATPANIIIDHRAGGLQRRVSSLAAMTPESIEAAVQQAGSGLEPVRVGVPQEPADDLTVISGIGADAQKELNALGIFYYWQVAGWGPEQIAWLGSRIQAPQRVGRENWMAQAARLARMGQA